jgi:hypothetical protein
LGDGHLEDVAFDHFYSLLPTLTVKEYAEAVVQYYGAQYDDWKNIEAVGELLALHTRRQEWGPIIAKVVDQIPAFKQRLI